MPRKPTGGKPGRPKKTEGPTASLTAHPTPGTPGTPASPASAGTPDAMLATRALMTADAAELPPGATRAGLLREIQKIDEVLLTKADAERADKTRAELTQTKEALAALTGSRDYLQGRVNELTAENTRLKAENALMRPVFDTAKQTEREERVRQETDAKAKQAEQTATDQAEKDRLKKEEHEKRLAEIDEKIKANAKAIQFEESRPTTGINLTSGSLTGLYTRREQLTQERNIVLGIEPAPKPEPPTESGEQNWARECAELDLKKRARAERAENADWQK